MGAADADVTQNDTVIAAVAANILIFIIVSVFYLWPDLKPLLPTVLFQFALLRNKKTQIQHLM